MLRKVIVLTVILIATIFLLGVTDNREYAMRVTHVMVDRGDTLDGIAGDFYGKDKRGLSWAEYRNEIMELNIKLQNKVRCLQPGDVVEIRYYE